MSKSTKQSRARHFDRVMMKSAMSDDDPKPSQYTNLQMYGEKLGKKTNIKDSKV